jgi:hypothetical protein
VKTKKKNAKHHYFFGVLPWKYIKKTNFAFFKLIQFKLFFINHQAYNKTKSLETCTSRSFWLFRNYKTMHKWLLSIYTSKYLHPKRKYLKLSLPKHAKRLLMLLQQLPTQYKQKLWIKTKLINLNSQILQHSKIRNSRINSHRKIEWLP